MKLYFFHNANYIGYFDVIAPMHLVFHLESNNLDKASKILLEWMNNFSTPQSINNFLEERVMPDEREDKSLYASMVGAKSLRTWDILVAIHCVSGQDTFWWDEKKSPDFYNNYLSRVNSQE